MFSNGRTAVESESAGVNLKTVIYTLEDIRSIVHYVGLDRIMDEAIDSLHAYLECYSAGEHVIPVREGVEYSAPATGLIEWMPAMRYGNEVRIKIVGYHPDNPRHQNLPTIMSTLLCFDTRNGHLVSVMDGNLVTAIRTGAASAVASRVLARPESKTLGLIGCGAQAISQLHALSRIFDLQQVLLYDVDGAAQATFARRASCLGLEAVDMIKSSPAEIASRADVICTATSIAVGHGPVLNDCGLKESVHINAVGSDFPGKLEIPQSLLMRSLVCPDFLPQAIREGECQQLREQQIGPDLVELIKEHDVYQRYRNSCTVFDSTGWALEDYVTIELFARYGRALGCGTELPLSNATHDPLNPYASLSSHLGIARNAV